MASIIRRGHPVAASRKSNKVQCRFSICAGKGYLFYSGSFFFSSRRRHTRSVSAFLLNRSSDLNTNLSKQQQVSEIMRQMLTQAQTAGQYFTNDQIKEMTRKVSAEV